jgi:hypothetical protein
LKVGVFRIGGEEWSGRIDGIIRAKQINDRHEGYYRDDQSNCIFTELVYFLLLGGPLIALFHKISILTKAR